MPSLGGVRVTDEAPSGGRSRTPRQLARRNRLLVRRRVALAGDDPYLVVMQAAARDLELLLGVAQPRLVRGELLARRRQPESSAASDPADEEYGPGETPRPARRRARAGRHRDGGRVRRVALPPPPPPHPPFPLSSSSSLLTCLMRPPALEEADAAADAATIAAPPAAACTRWSA